MKSVLGVALAAIAILLVWGLSGHRSAAKAKAQRVQDSIAAEDARITALESARAVWEAEQHRLVDSVDAVRAKDRQSLAALRATNSRLAGDLAVLLAADSSLPDSTFERVSHVIGQLGQENERCASALATCDSAVAIRDRLLRAADSTITERGNLLHAYRAQNADLWKLANPPWYQQIRDAAPWVAVALAVGLTVGLVAR